MRLSDITWAIAGGLLFGLVYPVTIVGLLKHAGIWNVTHALAFTAGMLMVVGSRMVAQELSDERRMDGAPDDG